MRFNNSAIFEGTQIQGTYDQLDELSNISFDGLADPLEAVVFTLTSNGTLIVPQFSLIAIANIAE